MNKAWYYKTWFISILLILFYPLGMILMWAGECFKMSARIAITVIIGLFWLVVIFSPDNQNTVQLSSESKVQIENQEESEAIPQKASILKPISLSYEDVMGTEFSKYFTMKSSPLHDGRERMLGQTDKNGSAILEIIGDKNNITQASLLISVNTPKTEVERESLAFNSIYMLYFLKRTLPNLKASDWVLKAIEQLNDPKQQTLFKIYGNRKLQVTNTQIGLISLTVNHKDS